MRTPVLIPTACLATLLLLAGAASALPLVDVQADARASVDASGAQKLASDTLADAQARVESAKADAEATARGAHAQADAKAEATVETGHGLVASLGQQMASFGAWIRGLFGAASEAKAEIHAEAQARGVLKAG